MKIHTAFIKNVLTFNRFLIPYRVYGNGGPHLICVNGAQQSMAMWATFINRFASYYRIVVFDLPGQGKARIRYGKERVSLAEQVAILREVIKTSGIKDFAICSASWGGVLALAYAVEHPDRVKRLVLGGIGVRPNQRMIETIKKGCQLDEQERDEMAKVLINAFGENLPENFKKRIFKQFRSMSQAKLRAFSEHGAFVISAGSLADLLDVRKVQTDTVIINGEKDKIIDLDDAKFLARQMPNCRLRIAENVGHFLHLEDEKVLEIYGELLRELRAPQPVPACL